MSLHLKNWPGWLLISHANCRLRRRTVTGGTIFVEPGHRKYTTVRIPSINLAQYFTSEDAALEFVSEYAIAHGGWA